MFTTGIAILLVFKVKQYTIPVSPCFQNPNRPSVPLVSEKKWGCWGEWGGRESCKPLQNIPRSRGEGRNPKISGYFVKAYMIQYPSGYFVKTYMVHYPSGYFVKAYMVHYPWVYFVKVYMIHYPSGYFVKAYMIHYPSGYFVKAYMIHYPLGGSLNHVLKKGGLTHGNDQSGSSWWARQQALFGTLKRVSGAGARRR